MILLAHMLFGAAIGAQLDNPYFALPLALLGHYFLDIFPHVEYSISHIKNKEWKKAWPDFLKVFLDFLLALVIIFWFSKNQPLMYACALIAIVPDGFTLINSVVKNKILAAHSNIHEGRIHYLTKQKKFPIFWRIATQVAAIIISIIFINKI